MRSLKGFTEGALDHWDKAMETIEKKKIWRTIEEINEEIIDQEYEVLYPTEEPNAIILEYKGPRDSKDWRHRNKYRPMFGAAKAFSNLPRSKNKYQTSKNTYNAVTK